MLGSSMHNKFYLDKTEHQRSLTSGHWWKLLSGSLFIHQKTKSNKEMTKRVH